MAKCGEVLRCLAHASIGCVYGRPNVIECDMHYGRPSMTECEYHAYVYKYSNM